MNKNRTMKNYTHPWLITADEDKEKTFVLKNSGDPDPLPERIGGARFIF